MKHFKKYILILPLVALICAAPAFAQESSNSNVNGSTGDPPTTGSSTSLPQNIEEDIVEDDANSLQERETQQEDKDEIIISPQADKKAIQQSGSSGAVTESKTISDLENDLFSLRILVSVLFVMVAVLLFLQLLTYLRRTRLE